MRSDASDSTSGVLSILNDTGMVVGVDSDLTIGVSGTDVSISNATSDGDILIKVNDGGVVSTAMTFDGATNRVSVAGAPSDSLHIATKAYVDQQVSTGVTYHQPVAAATTTTLATATSGTISYTQPNGVANGIGAYISTTGTFTNIDGYAINVGGTRILVKNEANTAHNGIYVWSNATVITRADDFNTPAEMAGGDFTFVQAGALYDKFEGLVHLTNWAFVPIVALGFPLKY